MAAKESQAQSRTLLAYIVSPVIIADRKDKIVYLNPSGLQTFGKKIADLLGKDFTELFDPETALTLASGLDELRGGRTQRSLSMEIQERHYSISLSPIRDDYDTYAGALLHFLDTTAERKNMQMLDDLLSAVINDVTTPLKAAKSTLKELMALFSQHEVWRLSDTLRNSWSARLREMVDEMDSIPDRLTGMVSLSERNLDISHSVEQQKNANLTAILRSAIQSVDPFAHKKGVLLESHIEEIKLPIKCVIDQISFVLVNLLSFGLQQSPAGDSITVSSHFDPSNKGGWITLAFGGPGFNSPVIGKLLSGEGDGSQSIPLPVLNDILQFHRGNLCLESFPGVGSAFAIWLPLSEA